MTDPTKHKLLLCPTCDHATHDYCYIRHIYGEQTECAHYKPIGTCGKAQPAPASTEVREAEKIINGPIYADGAHSLMVANAARTILAALRQAQGEVERITKREDELERVLDDKWRTRKYIVCREYQLADTMCIAMRLMDEIAALRAENAKLAEEIKRLRAEVEAVNSWAGCRQCWRYKTDDCRSCIVDSYATRFAPRWLPNPDVPKEATK